MSVKTSSPAPRARTTFLQSSGHHRIVGRRERVKIQRSALSCCCCAFASLMAARATAISLEATFTSARVASCTAFDVSAVSTEVMFDLHELLPTLIDGLGIVIVRLRLFEAGRGLLQIGLGLFDGGLGAAALARSARGRRGGPEPRPSPRDRRHPPEDRRALRTTLNPTLDVTRASTVPRPKTCTGTSRSTLAT